MSDVESIFELVKTRAEKKVRNVEEKETVHPEALDLIDLFRAPNDPSEDDALPNFLTAVNPPTSFDRKKQVEEGSIKVFPSVSHFYLGPPGGGTPMRIRYHSYNALVYGEKLWFVLPRALALYSKQSMLSFLKEQTQATDDFFFKNVLRCRQRSGDIVYIPHYWAYGDLNIKTSIGGDFILTDGLL